jgi:hypothetical protein
VSEDKYGMATQEFDPDAIAKTILDGNIEEIPQYEPGEIPPQWQEALQRYGISVLRLAMIFGYIIPEYTMRDYVEYAIESPGGYETIDIWGVQGSKKSNRTMQIAFWVYGDWDVVLREMVLVPDAKDLAGYEDRGFLQKMKSIARGRVKPLVAWDDLTVSLPSSSFKTDIDVYGAVDAAWAAIRTKIKVMVLNNPLIDRITKNIKDNVSIEVMIGRNQVEQIERWFHLVGLKQQNSNFFKVQIEPLHKFDWRQVPVDVFREYQNLRLEIADYAVHKMGKAMDDSGGLEGEWLNPIQIMNEIDIAPSSLNDMYKRNFIPHKKVNGVIWVSKQDFDDFKACWQKNAGYKKRKEG